MAPEVFFYCTILAKDSEVGCRLLSKKKRRNFEFYVFSSWTVSISGGWPSSFGQIEPFMVQYAEVGLKLIMEDEHDKRLSSQLRL